MRRLLWVGGAAVALTVAIVAVAVAAARGGGPAAGEQAAPATAPVLRGDLVSTRQLRGTVDYGPVTPVESPAPGIVTALTAVGTTVSRGQPLFALDDRPVVLLYGDLPMYRRLAPGASGRDVRELKENLAALGYLGAAADASYTEQTAAAVRRWQKALGGPQTGAVELGQVVFQAGPVRVAEHRTLKGNRADGPVLGITGTARLVLVSLVPADRNLAKPGTPVSVQLPDGTSAPGTVTDVVTPAAPQGAADAQPTVQAVITPSQPERLGAAADSGVQVLFTVASHPAVLSVPVLALLALSDGGYGVTLVEGATTRTVPVEVGMFTAGRVEISGSGIAAGQRVKVPSP
jgi:peptidoglycan hydrolase-like protein with peptidoglycan-binding domain